MCFLPLLFPPPPRTQPTQLHYIIMNWVGLLGGVRGGEKLEAAPPPQPSPLYIYT